MASLGKDLAQIRKKQNLSLDDIQQATKIPKRILRSIEDNSIFDDFDENSTYIRSYVRGYAKALSIDDKQIIHALDKREIDDYSGSLQKIAGIEPLTESEDEKNDETQEDIQEESSDQDEDLIHDHSSDSASEEEESTSREESSPESAPGSADHSDIRSIDWAQKGREFQSLKTGRSKIGLGIVVLVIAVCGGLFFFYFNGGNGTTNSNNNNGNQEAAPALSTDSLELNISSSTESDTADAEELPTEAETSAPNLQNESLDELADTLDIIMYAAYDRLQPVRVYTDISDNINPYWIEEGEAMRFEFVNEIRIRGDYDSIVLLMNGHVVENFREQFYNPDTRLVEINRSYFEGDPQWLQPAPDSLEIDAPPPSVIHERPTFN